MIQETSHTDRFKQQLRDSLRREAGNSHPVKFARHHHIYQCGDHAEMVYFIESGWVKLMMSLPEDRECILAIYSAGDVFGELCPTRSGTRLETAIAMQETNLRQVPRSAFLALLSRDRLLEGFVQYLMPRIVDQQQAIANLMTVDTEQRLGKTLLRLARTFGRREPGGICIEWIFSSEELSEMVGATRLRVRKFMKRFQNLELIETRAEHYLIIKDQRLADYLARIA
ncbi:MAG TPA: Crp/Fnr family transcriptional regulator [Blastocatellia bacterium]|nr:Crp/Fnr family transcriptional regulator [Blastocatellia bacterium]